MTEPISDDVRRFLASSIASVPHLEALLLLSADPHRDQPWSVEAVANRLYIAVPAAEVLLGELVDLGLLARSEQDSRRFFYLPRSPELAAVVQCVAEVYSARLVEVTKLIHSKSERKAQQFASAFRWRKE